VGQIASSRHRNRVASLKHSCGKMSLWIFRL
jgi:hypothetical protein